MSKFITLITDFGLQDEYVGVMKGVLLSRAPDSTIIDISHSILPQNIMQAGYCLAASYKFFPPGTIHVVVVDPGVGSTRHIICAKMGDYFFIAPDNGVLSLFFNEKEFGETRIVSCEEYYMKPVSRTFHGRDIFAPVVAALAEGMPLKKVGPSVSRDSLVHFCYPGVQIALQEGIIRGQITWVDHFGNLVTNIREEDWQRLGIIDITDSVQIVVGNGIVTPSTTSYAEVEPGNYLAVFGSRGFLEIAQNCGNASATLEITAGSVVEIKKV